jgi:hypothetical protein
VDSNFLGGDTIAAIKVNFFTLEMLKSAKSYRKFHYENGVFCSFEKNSRTFHCNILRKFSPFPRPFSEQRIRVTETVFFRPLVSSFISKTVSFYD